MRKVIIPAMILAAVLLAGATTVTVTAQAQGQENMKFPPERMLEIQKAIGDMV